ncbi:MAG: response regulator transcription factor [Bacteroidales bacterium]|nr:response regulator transcription factor [Bacteroidales bacterium]MBR5398849.1 response regulator transcription factor [Bacteroidales bacterium]
MEESKNKARILVIDDEEDICEILQYNLEKAGYQVKTVFSAEEALSEIAAQKFDLLLLDIMLGGISGLKLAKLLREDYKSNVPIIFVTALDTEDDILKGFRTGGDDYISKPFSVNEVIARVGAVLSRSGRKMQTEASSSAWKRADSGTPDSEQASSEDVLQTEFDFGSLKVNAAENHVVANGVEVFLTRKEMDILLLLARSAGKIFSREDILKKVWRDDSFVLQRTVDVHIARLRKKLGKAGELIQNRSGYGYCIQKPHSA